MVAAVACDILFVHKTIFLREALITLEKYKPIRKGWLMLRKLLD
jgi:hypothetical protein